MSDDKSPSTQAFLAWFGDASEGGTPEYGDKAAWEAGVEWALAQAGETNRKGSGLRGRVISMVRPLTPEEIGRENEQLSGDLIWPALHLDDGTLVYAAKEVGVGGGSYGPALLAGARVNEDGEVDKLTFDVSVHDVPVQQAQELEEVDPNDA